MRSEIESKVRKLYTQTTFTNMADFSPLLKSIRAKNLGGNAVEVGCGGGGILIFLSKKFKHVTGIDLTPASLNEAKANAKKLKVKNASFIQGSILNPKLVNLHKEKYDYAISYGVLHHTADPEKGAINLVKMAKPNGHVTIGVYSRTNFLYRIKRKIVLMIAGNDFAKRRKWARRLFYKNKILNESEELFINDAYVHPQVSFHSPRQVLSWFEKSGCEYSGSWPPIELEAYPRIILNRLGLAKEIPLKARRPGILRKLSLPLVEFIWLISGISIMINISARRKNVR